jgi:steroid delta-isomerase-like uncharacterized protein
MQLAWVVPAFAETVAATGATATQAPERMSRWRTEEVMREYLAALLGNGPFANSFADDIVVTLVDVGQEIVGREAAEAAIVNFHQVAFAAKPEVKTFTAGSGIAWAELVLVGTHTGDFVGIPATGRSVRVPYVAVYDLADDKITALRLYGPAAGLVQQLTASESPSS